MRDVSLAQRTTTSPEKTCAFRDATCFRVAFGRILHEVPDGPAGAFNPGEAEGPPAGFVGLGQNKSSWNPQKAVVVRAASLGEFEDPLPAYGHPFPAAVVPDVGDELADAFGYPLVVIPVRERDEDRVEPRPTPLEPAPCCIRRTDHHPPHSAYTSFLVQALEDFSY